MPGYDQCGPRGAGPMTGGRRGRCNPTYTGAAQPFFTGRGSRCGFGGGTRGGAGRGRGYGLGYGRQPAFPSPDIAVDPSIAKDRLTAEAQRLEDALKSVQ